MVKVEIGPGPEKIDDSWITVGPYLKKEVDIVAKWGKQPLPFKDESVDLIYASHVLEHVWWYDTLTALEDIYRILKPGGALELHVPDFEKIVNSYTSKKCGDTWFKFNLSEDFMTWVNGRIFTYGGPGNTHRAVFDRPYLKKCLYSAGFSKIVDNAPIRGMYHGNINLAITGYKV